MMMRLLHWGKETYEEKKKGKKERMQIQIFGNLDWGDRHTSWKDKPSQLCKTKTKTNKQILGKNMESQIGNNFKRHRHRIITNYKMFY